MKPVDVVKKLQADNSKLAKQAVLKKAWDAGCKDFFIAANLCFDGLISFGIKQIPTKLHNSGKEDFTFDDFIGLTDDLRQRIITGNAARATIEKCMQSCDKEEWDLVYRPVLLRDFKCGLSESTVNKVLKTLGKEAEQYLIHDMPYQRCSLPKSAKLDAFSWKVGVLSQKKADGMFINCNHHEDGTIDLLSRAGRPMPQDEFQALVADIAKNIPKGTQTHGEFLVFRNGRELERKTGNGILNHVSDGGKFELGDTPVYVVWDQIPLTSAVIKGEYKVAYVDRFAEITKQLSKATEIQLIETKYVHDIKEAFTHYYEMVILGYEGTIIKDRNATWKDGTSKFQVKMKVDADVDLEIDGFNPGNGKNEATFGSIRCCTLDRKLVVNVSGFDDDERQRISDEREELLGGIMTVRANSIMIPRDPKGVYSLFLPRSVEIRKDKSVADTLEQVIAQFEAALANAA